MSQEIDNKFHLIQMTAEITAAYAAKNALSPDELSGMIPKIYAAFNQLGQVEEPAEELLEPAVPIKKSITPDYLICLEDGKKLKMLKRHLRTAFGLSPEEYRRRWGLSADYPMVAPNYAKHRRDLAREIGLGAPRKG